MATYFNNDKVKFILDGVVYRPKAAETGGAPNVAQCTDTATNEYIDSPQSDEEQVSK